MGISDKFPFIIFIIGDDIFMKLTKKQLETLPTLYSQENETNLKAYIHFFNPIGRGDWYAMEGRQEGDDFLFFGYVRSPLGADCDEYGYFTLNQIRETKILELDKQFEPTLIQEVISNEH